MTTLLPLRELLLRLDALPEARRLPDELARSFPIPAPATAVRLQFLGFFKSGRPPAPPQISSPKYRMAADAEKILWTEIKEVTSADFGIAHDDALPIGVHDFNPPLPMDEFRAKKARLFECYDILLPIYTGTKKLEGPRAEFLKLFLLLAEKPLHPYFRYLNPDFFRWLREI